MVQQYAINGTNAQRWFIRDSGAGYYLQSALGNWVLDLSGGSTSNGTAIRLYAPNGTQAQRFVVSSSEVSVPVNAAVNIKSAGNPILYLMCQELLPQTALEFSCMRLMERTHRNSVSSRLAMEPTTLSM